MWTINGLSKVNVLDKQTKCICVGVFVYKAAFSERASGNFNFYAFHWGMAVVGGLKNPLTPETCNLGHKQLIFF